MKDYYNIVLLNKNKSVKIISKEENISDYNPEYMLIPMIEYDTNTFIPIKPKKKLLNFTNSQISVTLQLKNDNYDNEEDCTVLELFTLKKSFTSIVEIINFIHSIDRIDYVNAIFNMNRWNEFEIIDIKEIDITLFRNDNIIYEYSFSAKYSSGYYDKSNCMTVTLDLEEDLYELGNKYIGCDRVLNIRNNKWSIDLHPDMNSIIGINLLVSQSIYFIEYDMLMLFKNKTLTYELLVFNIDDLESIRNKDYSHINVKESIENDELEIYTNLKYVQKDITLIIEFLIYIRLLYTMTIMKFNNVLYNDFSYNKGFDMFLEIVLEDKNNKEKISFNILKDKIIPFNKMIEKINNKWGR